MDAPCTETSPVETADLANAGARAMFQNDLGAGGDTNAFKPWDPAMPQLPTGPFRYKRRSSLNSQLGRTSRKTKPNPVRVAVRRFLAFMSTTSASQKRYLFSALLWAMVIVIHLTPLRNDPTWASVTHLALIVWLLAMALDGVRVYERIKATTVGNWVIWGLGLALGNFLVVTAAQEVAVITSEDPSKFPHTVAMVALLEVPQLTIVVLILITVPWVVFGFLGLMHEFSPELKLLWFDKPEPPARTEPYAIPSKVIRFASFTALLIYIGINWQHGIPGYDAWVKQRAEGFLYTFEMYTKSACVAAQGRHHTLIGDAKVLIGTENKGVYAFSSVECKAEAPKKMTLSPLPSDQSPTP
ncbi:MAG: putative rane protein [Nevskia sp.]|nr:putative rane protein [Nevskia sp.]